MIMLQEEEIRGMVGGKTSERIKTETKRKRRRRRKRKRKRRRRRRGDKKN